MSDKGYVIRIHDLFNGSTDFRGMKEFFARTKPEIPIEYTYTLTGAKRALSNIRTRCFDPDRYQYSIERLDEFYISVGKPKKVEEEQRVMTCDNRALQWIREPKESTIDDGRITITTEPHTDLWQRTYYHFRNDNAPALQMETDEKFFSFIVKTDFSGSHHRFDQCGIVMYIDSENWLKGSVEYENEQFQHLGSVVTNHGYSDWATTAIPANVKVMWYRFSRREDDYCIECSTDGEHFSQMRICHMWEGAGRISFGIYACSPENSSFTAVFTDMRITECAWKAHDGQKPDAELGMTTREFVSL